MNFFANNRVLVAIVLALVVAAVAWFGLSSGGGSSSLLTTQNVDSSGGNTDLIQTLLQLRAVTLSGTIFSDPTFVSLHDFTTQIVLEPVGRDNPFASLAATTSATMSAHTSQLFSAPKGGK